MVGLNLHGQYAPAVLVGDIAQDLPQACSDDSGQNPPTILRNPHHMVGGLKHRVGRRLHLQHAQIVLQSGRFPKGTRLLPGLKSGVSGAGGVL